MHKRAVAAVTLLGLVILATVAILVAQQAKYRNPQPSPTPTVEPAARTLLVQVRDPSLLALGTVLMGIDGDNTQLDQLWVPPDWWIDQVGPQEVSAADLGRKPVTFVINAVQSQTQVPLDDAWVMDRLAFAGLIDALGGVRIDVPTRMAYLDEQGLPKILEAGPQTLAGGEAASYVLDPSLRNETMRLVRFQSVWDQVLRRFPTDQEKARTLIVSLGALSKATMNTDVLADYLSQAKDLRVRGDYAERTVPLTPDNFVRVQPPQGVTRAYALDTNRMARRMQALFQDYPPLEEPIARLYAAAFRSEDLETMRDQLATRGWVAAWGGRTTQMVSGAVVTPRVSEAQALGLQEAVGMIPATGELPWGDARVDVTRTSGS